MQGKLLLRCPFLQAYLLQTVEGKHQDLKYISPEMVRAAQMPELHPSCSHGLQWSPVVWQQSQAWG